MELNWRTSWADFVHHVAALSSDGLSDAEISERLGNSIVQWVGTYSESRLDAKYARGVILAMPELQVPLRQGGVLDAGHLYVETRAEDDQSWRRRQLGSVVRFEGRLVDHSELYPGVSLSVNRADNLVLLMPTIVDRRAIDT